MAFETVHTLPTPKPAAKPIERRDDPRIRLAQLSRLHDEAAETSLLANLLGRAPQVTAALAGCALLTVALSFNAVPTAQIGVWFALAAAGAIAIWRAYARAIQAPFERATLKNFAGDLSAILFYAGFAWGAGAFLALPAQSNPLIVMLFAAAPAALIAGLLRARAPALVFLAPVAGLATLATLIRPLGGLAATGLVIAACAAVAGVTYWAERVSAREPAPELAALALR
jgi:hypothetical protein